MIRVHPRLALVPLAVALVTCVSCAPESGQAYEPERTSWGTPKIEGLWDFRTLTPLQRPLGSGMNLHLTERFTLVGEGRLLYEYTVDAPTTFVQPFTVSIPLRATKGPMFEYACHQANYAMPGVLKGGATSRSGGRSRE